MVLQPLFLTPAVFTRKSNFNTTERRAVTVLLETATVTATLACLPTYQASRQSSACSCLNASLPKLTTETLQWQQVLYFYAYIVVERDVEGKVKSRKTPTVSSTRSP